jgi:prophage DNA circulation protein
MIGASFRGVPFLVDASERSGGRRVAVHEFPFRDDPFVEDLSRKARSFRVDGYVIGDDYLSQRDALLAALEDTAGPGELIHPYHGNRRAICSSLSVRESRTEGGIAIFAIEFAETPTQTPVPVVAADPISDVAAAADAAVASTKAEFTEKYDPAGIPSFALASASGALTRAAAGLSSALSPAVTVTQELSTMTGQISLLTDQAATLVRQPDAVLDAFRSVIVGLGGSIVAAPGAVMSALFDAYGTYLGAIVTGETPTRVREIANQEAMNGALRRIIAIEAARLAPLVPYVSVEQATAARDQVAAMLEEQAATAGDTAYPALVTLRSTVLHAVPGAAVLASIVTVTRRTAIPSLLLSYQLYGSVDQEADILARNSIRHPGFIAGDLKVLSDV